MKENPGANLPNRPIGVVRRADRSGTTSNFTKFLATRADGVWRLGSGDSVPWPAGTTQADGNRWVAQLIANNNGAIGYVDLGDANAHGLKTAAILNRAGVYVRPTPGGLTAAMTASTIEDDLTFQPLDAQGPQSYPLTAATYALVRTTYPDRETAEGVKAFMSYLLSDGQDLAPRVGYARLPDSLRVRALAAVERIAVRSAAG